MSKKFLQIIVFGAMSGFGIHEATSVSPCKEGETMHGEPVFDPNETAAMKVCQRSVCFGKINGKIGTCRPMKFIQHTTDRGDIKGSKVACCLPE